MRRLMRAVAVAALALAPACARQKAGATRMLPPGDAIWFSEGLGADQSQIEEVLARGGFAHVFLPALRLIPEGGGWKAAAAAPPARPFAALPVVLVVQASPDLAPAPSPGAQDSLAAAIGGGLRAVMERRAAYGRVEGVLLDLPLPGAWAEGVGTVAQKVHPLLPSGLFLTCSLRIAPAEKQREDFVKPLRAVDGFVAFVFGEGPLADPVATEALGKPWWAAYAPAARGEWTDASGRRLGTLTEKALRALTDDARVSVGNDLTVRQEGVSGFVFRPSAPVEVSEATLSPGDQVAFRQPLVSELLYRFGSDLAGRHLVRGRLVVLDGLSDSDRIFTLAALSDVLLGRPLIPDLRVSVTAESAGVRVAAENPSAHASVVSRTANWVEVDVPFGHIRDVQVGGFDRYEVFDAEGRPVTPGRATRVRFYETLIAPRERIEEAAILVRVRPPADCCRFRSHLLAASGTEVAGDWIAPPPAPTPTPVPRRRLKRR